MIAGSLAGLSAKPAAADASQRLTVGGSRDVRAQLHVPSRHRQNPLAGERCRLARLCSGARPEQIGGEQAEIVRGGAQYKGVMQAFRHITATEGIGGLYRCSRSPSSLLFCPLCGEKGPARINSDKGARACGAEAKKRFAASAQVQHDCAVVCMCCDCGMQCSAVKAQ